MITTETYTRIITDYIALLERSEVNNWFQEDKAHPRTTKETMQFLQSVFADQLISTDLQFPHSPDLSPLDFHLWDHLKDSVFRISPATIGELKARITEEINKIDGRMLENVFSNLISHCQACIQADVRHFQQYF